MRRLLLALALLLSGCIPADRPAPEDVARDEVRVWHDAEHQVTCWIYYSRGISCLPDEAVR